MPVLCLLALATTARAELPLWEELTLPAGGRLLAVGTERPGWVAIGLAFPAGTAQSPEDPDLALLAPRLFLGSRLEGKGSDRDLGDFLDEKGWMLREGSELDGAGVFLAGPTAGLRELLLHVAERLQHPDAFSPEELAAAWARLEEDRTAWAKNPEVPLRAAMAREHYGAHPYRHFLAQERPASSGPPDAADMRHFLRERYQAGALHLLAAGDLVPADFLDEWLPRFEKLGGQALDPVLHPAVKPGSGRIERDMAAGRSLLLVQYPGVHGGRADTAELALAAGILQQLLDADIVRAGLARGASAFFDVLSPGPRPLELQVRGFRPEQRERVEERALRIVDRVRSGEFSPYQVISAKDMIFQQLDATTRKGAGPTAAGPQALLLWSQQVLRRELHYRRWGEGWEARLLGTGKERIVEVASRRLRAGTETFGLLLPDQGLD